MCRSISNVKDAQNSRTCEESKVEEIFRFSLGAYESSPVNTC